MTRLTGHLLTLAENFSRSGRKPAAKGEHPFVDLLNQKPMRPAALPVRADPPRLAAQDSEQARKALTAAAAPIDNLVLKPALQYDGADALGADQQAASQPTQLRHAFAQTRSDQKDELAPASETKGIARQPKADLPPSAGSVDAPPHEQTFSRPVPDLPKIAVDAEPDASGDSLDDAADQGSAAAAAPPLMQDQSRSGLAVPPPINAENPTQHAPPELAVPKLLDLPACTEAGAEEASSAPSPRREVHLSGEARTIPADTSSTGAAPLPRQTAGRSAKGDFPALQLADSGLRARADEARGALSDQRPEERDAALVAQARSRKVGAEPQPVLLPPPSDAPWKAASSLASPALLGVDVGERNFGPEARIAALSPPAGNRLNHSGPRASEFTEPVAGMQNPDINSRTTAPLVSPPNGAPQRETPNDLTRADSLAMSSAQVSANGASVKADRSRDWREPPPPALAAAPPRAADGGSYISPRILPPQGNPPVQTAQPSNDVQAWRTATGIGAVDARTLTPAAGERQRPVTPAAPNDDGLIKQRPQQSAAAAPATDVIARIQAPLDAGQGFGSLIAAAVTQSERPEQALTPSYTQVDRSTGEVKVIRLLLHPEDLGQLSVSLRRRGAQIHISLQAETAPALARLSAERDEITRSLEAIGVAVSGITVLPMAETSNAGRSGELGGGAPLSFAHKDGGGSARGQPERPTSWSFSLEDDVLSAAADTDGETYI